MYLAYRLEQAGVCSLGSVWILDGGRPWLLEDLAAELAALFPGVEVVLSPPQGGRPDLALIPFFDTECDLRARRRLLREAARSNPGFLGLFEMRKRRLTVVPRRRLSSYLLRLTAEEWLRFAARVRGGVLRRARRLVAGNGGVTR